MQGIKHAGCNNNENRKEYHRSSWDSIGGIKPQTNVTGEKIPNKKKKKKKRERRRVSAPTPAPVATPSTPIPYFICPINQFLRAKYSS